MHDELLPYGYDLLTIDEGWYWLGGMQSTNASLDAYGRPYPRVDQYPSAAGGAGFAPLVEQITALGLDVGVWSIRGIPRAAVAAKLPIAGTSFTCDEAVDVARPNPCAWNGYTFGCAINATTGHCVDAAVAYYASVVELYKSWGLTFTKLDCMFVLESGLTLPPTEVHRATPHRTKGAPPHTPPTPTCRWGSAAPGGYDADLIAFTTAFRGSGIEVSLSPGKDVSPQNITYLSKHKLAVQTRVTGDFWDSWSSLKTHISVAEEFEPFFAAADGAAFTTAVDLDMMPIGDVIVDGRLAPSRFLPSEARLLVTLWAFVGAPMIMGGDLPPSDPATLALLTNARLLRVHDAAHSRRVLHPVAGGADAHAWGVVPNEAANDAYVVLINAADAATVVSVALADMPWVTAATVCAQDLWTGDAVPGAFTGTFAAKVPLHAAAAFRLTGCAGSVAAPTTGFITRSGTQLLDEHGSPFRFAGANVYWLGLDENVGGVHYPTPFRIRDGLTTAAGLGARVIRAHTVGVSTGNPLSFEPALGVFNASALDAADFAVAVAGELGLRLIVPLTDNYKYYHGGKHDFTDWLHLPEASFYTDERAITAFEAYISARLSHVNPYTGRATRDEPAIALWETGNEMSGAPPAWTERIAAFIKSVDPNHLVLDGHYGVVAPAAGSAVDVCSDHYYPVNEQRLALAARTAAGANRVFVAGEYEWTTGNVTSFLAAAAANENVSGTSFWSLFPHNDAGGFVKHSDGFTVVYDPAGPDAPMNAFLPEFAAHAGAMVGSRPIVPPAPGAPTILSAAGGSLAWRGAALAAVYDVRVSVGNAGGPWMSACPCAAGCDVLCVTDDASPLALNGTLVPAGAWVMLSSVGAAGETGAWSEAVVMSS